MSMSTLSVDLVAGETLGEYRVEQLLGRGNLNAVYQARHQGSSREVMLTVFLLPSSFSPQARARFIARFTIVASNLLKLRHPYIQIVEDFGEHCGLPYMVSPLVSGSTLARILSAPKRLTPLQISRILRKMGEALDYTHSRGVAHGALRPLNIWLDEQKLQIVGYGLGPMLALQGLVGSDHPYAHLLSMTGSFLGAPEYIAPEVVLGCAINPRADVYGLGAMAFEMLCGQPPFTNKDPFVLARMHAEEPIPSMACLGAEVPEALELTVQKALARKPEDRFQTAGEFAASFTRVVKMLEAPEHKLEIDKQMVAGFSGSLITGPLTSGSLSWGGVPPRPVSGYLSTTSHKLQAMPHKVHFVPPTVTTSFERLGSLQGLKESELPTIAKTQPLNSGGGIEQHTSGEYEHVQNGFATVPMTPLNCPQSAVETPEKAISENKIKPLPGSMKVEEWMKSLKKQTRQVPGRALDMSVDMWTSQDRNSRKRMLIVLAAALLVLVIGGVSLAFASHATVQRASGPRQTIGKPISTPPPVTTTPEPAKKEPEPTSTPAPQKIVIGNTNQGYGTALDFNNPADGKKSLLIRMNDGNFVAYESSCTTDGGQLTYDAVNNKLICGADGSIFDPANGGNVVSGPATTPRKQIPLIVNTDGTVTVDQ
ncbi:protein kinase domain-containing protein [Ktedonospora formicarum]|uniref:non-specific serine/threonine protein kinase n=1 Tax=Ktedonospora formicarum TaxID=2778364 RepID=A0A8J3I3W9_9CHLR|nr:protein kinase [Ktedonospora formicarum]GHO46395.1 hypothetical protein KSX_45580 [Ktedonospora formicarum]